MTSGLDKNEFGFYEGECQGSNIFMRVNNVRLCEKCAAKLDRDLIRQRDWPYSMMAHGVPPEKIEELRSNIIRKYGENLESIAKSERYHFPVTECVPFSRRTSSARGVESFQWIMCSSLSPANAR